MTTPIMLPLNVNAALSKAAIFVGRGVMRKPETRLRKPYCSCARKGAIAFRIAILSFKGAEASNGASLSMGISTPASAVRSKGSGGMRGTFSAATRSQIRTSCADGRNGTRFIPSPRISINPASALGVVTVTPRSRASIHTWSSETRPARKPSSSASARKRRAKSDLPEPDAPRSNAARSPSATQVPWASSRVIASPAQAAGKRMTKRAPLGLVGVAFCPGPVSSDARFSA